MLESILLAGIIVPSLVIVFKLLYDYGAFDLKALREFLKSRKE